LLPDAPVPDGRTVLTGLDATGVGAEMGHGRHLETFIRDTNPLERFNREIGRRTDVVGIFPDDRSLIRLASMLAIEQNDEWLVGRALPVRRVDGAAPRGAAPSHKRRGGPRAPTGLSSPALTDEREREFLHHFPGVRPELGVVD
jgi:Transposase, Mutator family